MAVLVGVGEVLVVVLQSLEAVHVCCAPVTQHTAEAACTMPACAAYQQCARPVEQL